MAHENMTIGPFADSEPLPLKRLERSCSLEELQSQADAAGKLKRRQLEQLIEEIYVWRNALKVHGILRKNADR